MNARDLLDDYAVGHEAGAIGCRGFNRRDHAPAAFDALRAVLDLHKPDANSYSDVVYCDRCIDGHEDRVPYPCATVQAIITALEAS